jgi:pimeloyl-ACP methyl ester carboxylesterase
VAEIGVNGVRLYYEFHGEGPPLALVHGSWGDAASWQFLLPSLAESFRVLVYDRRGHTRSERPSGQGSVHEDAEDLASLLEALDFTPTHVVANSYGGNVALRLAAKQAAVFRSLSCHEPPLWDLVADDAESQELREQQARSEEAVGKRIAAGDDEGAAEQFVEEVAFGPGAWEQLPPQVRTIFAQNAPTFLDELRDPDQYGADLAGLRQLEIPLRLTQGSESLPVFARAIDQLVQAVPRIRQETIEGADHVPQLSVPVLYAETIASFVRELEARAAPAVEPPG